MRTLVSLALTTALCVSLTAPALGVVVSTLDDERLSDIDSTVDLKNRVEPMLVIIEDAADRIAEDVGDAEAWQSIRDAAREGLATTLKSRVRECSKDYWAMTYAMFGLYYLATTRMLDADEPTRAIHELATAMDTTNLSDSSYHRAARDCAVQFGTQLEGGSSADPSTSV